MARQAIGGDRVLEVLDVVLALAAWAERTVVDEARSEAGERGDNEARIGTALAVLDFEHHVPFVRPAFQCRVLQPCEATNELLRTLVVFAGRVDQRRRQFDRSEERRVGKECRSRWSPY